MKFISGKHILDGPFLMNEIHTWTKNSKLKAFLFKVDFEKGVQHSELGVLRLGNGTNEFWHEMAQIDSRMSFELKSISVSKWFTHG